MPGKGQFRSRPPGDSASRARVSLTTTNGLICAECHNALTVDTGGEPAIAFSHERHQNRGFHCNQCHPELGHSKNGGPVHAPGIKPGHPQCFTCHDGKKASNKCEYCHMRRSQPSPHPPDFLAIHDKSALQDSSICGRCHDQMFCENCHTVQMPHPQNWRGIHGQHIGEGDCARCHPKEFCNQCHKRTKPGSHQRKDFVRAHGGLAVLGANCTLCHPKQFCLNCHKLPMPHPSNWTRAHPGPGRLRRVPVLDATTWMNAARATRRTRSWGMRRSS